MKTTIMSKADKAQLAASKAPKVTAEMRAAFTPKSWPLTGPTPADLGAAAVKADDAARDAAKAPKILTGARGRVKAAKAAKAPAKKAPAKAARKAAKAPKAPAKGKAPAKAPKAAKAVQAPANGAPKYRGIWADAAEGAAKGKLPPAPDFSAATHTRFRAKLATLVELAKAGDIKGLKAVVINPISTSPKAMDRYRNLAVLALTVKAGA
jgi:hypothetical protein